MVDRTKMRTDGERKKLKGNMVATGEYGEGAYYEEITKREEVKHGYLLEGVRPPGVSRKREIERDSEAEKARLSA